MKLALYLPNFRDQVTVKELEDLTNLAEALDFDSVWTLDRLVVPESSDRGEMQYPFGKMMEFPTQLPVAAAGDTVAVNVNWAPQPDGLASLASETATAARVTPCAYGPEMAGA